MVTFNLDKALAGDHVLNADGRHGRVVKCPTMTGLRFIPLNPVGEGDWSFVTADGEGPRMAPKALYDAWRAGATYASVDAMRSHTKTLMPGETINLPRLLHNFGPIIAQSDASLSVVGQTLVKGGPPPAAYGGREVCSFAAAAEVLRTLPVCVEVMAEVGELDACEDGVFVDSLTSRCILSTNID